jgi:hypothetical protein
MLNQSFSIACLAWFVAFGVVCLHCVSLYYRMVWRAILLLREEKGFKLQKASDTHASTYLLIYALVFLVLCMIWDFQRSLWNA